MAASTEKMVRKQFLVPPSMATRLERLAVQHGISASEIVRRAVESYDPNDTEAMESEALMALVSERLKDAMWSTRKARRAAEEALLSLSER